VVQFEVLRLAARSRETGIYLRAIARRGREIAADIQAIGSDIRANAAHSRKTGIYWSEIATYSQEITADIQEMAANIGEIGIYALCIAAAAGE